jgi:regulator of ribonuclease activity A
VSSVRCFEDNSRIKEALESPGEGRVLVVDGGGSRRHALLGGNLGAAAVKNGWAGVIIHGCLRDSAELAPLPLGIRALGTMPLRSEKRGEGVRDVPVRFAGVTFRPGDWVYADEDGVVVSHGPLA